jgi:hypothetical protein
VNVSKPDLRKFNIVSHQLESPPGSPLTSKVSFHSPKREPTMSLLCQDVHLDSLRTAIPYSNFQTSMYRSVGIYAGEFSRLPISCLLVLRPLKCWAIAAFTSNVLQCTPVSFFWDKTQPGHCLPNALVTIGMTNGVLSFVGDLIILALPVPMIWTLQINLRRKIALNAIFLIGGFVCVTSIFRFVALAHINVKDITCKSAYLLASNSLDMKGRC